MENKKPTFNVFQLLASGFLMIATLAACGGLALLAVKWFVSLIKGGF